MCPGGLHCSRQVCPGRRLPAQVHSGNVRPAFAGTCMPRVRVKVEGVEVVVDTGGSAQVQSELSPRSSTDSFVLVPASPDPTPLSGYLPSLQQESPRAAGASRGSEVAPLSSAPYTASASVPPPFPSSSEVPEYPLQGRVPRSPAVRLRSLRPIFLTRAVS